MPHSSLDVSDDEGKTPLDLALERLTDTDLDKDDRNKLTKVVDYLKSLPAEQSELFLTAYLSLKALLTMLYRCWSEENAFREQTTSIKTTSNATTYAPTYTHIHGTL